MSSSTEEKTVEVSSQAIGNPAGHELADIELVEGKRSKKGILLRPQPSNDPNDPLVRTSSNLSYQYRIC
jgi:hypothetical protein